MALLAGLTLVAGPASAAPALPGSSFEIDEDANLRVDDPGLFDWANVTQTTGVDQPTGQNDDSYKGGTKEDTECPNEVTGSIPNNKSDLLTVEAWTEPGTSGHPGFFNFAWSRVSDPSGTTLMDFEFNQSKEDCPQGPNKVRTPGDLLVEYAIDQGGARASIDVRRWTGTEWGPQESLDQGTACGGGPCAVGTINSSTIPAAESDTLGVEKQPRTFGEAQLDLRFIFDSSSCVSFGSIMVKSRSSDSFTSQLKDFIRPIPVNLTNCGTVIIRKETLPQSTDGPFSFTKTFLTDPVSSDSFDLNGGDAATFNNVLFGSGTVDETSQAPGYVFDSVDCSASSGVSPAVNGSEVSFDIDAATDVVDCTYYNRAQAAITYVKSAERDGTSFDFSGTVGDFSLANGQSAPFTGLDPGTYEMVETEPTGWNLVSQDCDNGQTADAVNLSAGDEVTCTFVNEIERGSIRVAKLAKHAASESGTIGVAGVKFTVTNSNNGTNEEITTDSSGLACIDGLPVSVLDGDYTVTETVPDGYANPAPTQVVSVSESSCDGGDGTLAQFENTPLTNVTISVDSQIPGGTASVMECTSGQGTVSAGTNPDGDGSLTVSDLLPTDPDATITCTVVVDP